MEDGDTAAARDNGVDGRDDDRAWSAYDEDSPFSATKYEIL